MSDNQPTLITDEAALKELLQSKYPPASATFINDLPPEWKVNIVTIGCKCVYDDGHNDNKAADVNILGGGQSATLTATYTGCCRAYFVVMKVRYQKTGEEESFMNQKTVDQNYCGSNLKWHLIPAKQMLKGTPTQRTQPPIEVVAE